MSRKKIFIIGSNGQLGKYLSNNLKLDRSKYEVIKSKDYKIKFINIKKHFKILDLIKPDLIINCSAYTNVDVAEKQKKICKKLNFECVKILKEYCNKKCIVLIHFSTDYVFNGKNKFYEPNDQYRPINYYGYTKSLGEKEVLKSKNKFFIFRISWLISSDKLSFLKKIKCKILKKNKFKVISDSYSCPTTVLFINSFLRKNIDIFFKKKRLSGIYHLVNSKVLSFFDMAKYIEKLIFKKNFDIVQRSKYSNYKTLALRPKISKLGMKKTIKYFKLPKNTWKKDIEYLLK
jgi:dTDP-4-dehydrorhamnose reductase